MSDMHLGPRKPASESFTHTARDGHGNTRHSSGKNIELTVCLPSSVSRSRLGSDSRQLGFGDGVGREDVCDDVGGLQRLYAGGEDMCTCMLQPAVVSLSSTHYLRSRSKRTANSAERVHLSFSRTAAAHIDVNHLANAPTHAAPVPF